MTSAGGTPRAAAASSRLDTLPWRTTRKARPASVATATARASPSVCSMRTTLCTDHGRRGAARRTRGRLRQVVDRRAADRGGGEVRRHPAGDLARVARAAHLAAADAAASEEVVHLAGRDVR